MFQNVAYRPTVYKTGVIGRNKGGSICCRGKQHSLQNWCRMLSYETMALVIKGHDIGRKSEATISTECAFHMKQRP